MTRRDVASLAVGVKLRRNEGAMGWGFRITQTAARAAIIAVPIAACVVNEPEAPPRGVVVSGPPPAPVQEDRPAPPSVQSVWVPGYWHWTGMQYAWIPGHWDAPPPGSSWSAPQYSMHDGRYFYESGGWRAPTGTRNALR